MNSIAFKILSIEVNNNNIEAVRDFFQSNYAKEGINQKLTSTSTTLLMYARSYEMFKLLLENGADPNCINTNKCNALMVYYINLSNEEYSDQLEPITELLLLYGTDLSSRCVYNYTALDYFCIKQHRALYPNAELMLTNFDMYKLKKNIGVITSHSVVQNSNIF